MTESKRMFTLPDTLTITKEPYRPRTPDEEDAHDIYTKLIAAWNHHEAAAFGGLFARNGTAIGFDGSQMTGPKEIEASLHNIFKDHNPATYITKIREIRSISRDVIILRAVAAMVPPGEYDINPSLNTIQSLVLVRTGLEWEITFFQNTPARFNGRPEAVNELTRELRELI